MKRTHARPRDSGRTAYETGYDAICKHCEAEQLFAVVTRKDAERVKDWHSPIGIVVYDKICYRKL